MEQGGRAVIVAITGGGLGIALVWARLDPEPCLRHGAILLTANLTAGLWIVGQFLSLAGGMRLARDCGTAGVVSCWVHIPLSFHLAHRWSLHAAMAHVAEADSTGYGILASFAFLLLWTAETVRWWMNPLHYARRAPWRRIAIHGFLAFIVFNATVVYGGPGSRGAFSFLFSVLALMLAWHRRAR